MERENTKEFFETLGEICRDIAAIEFLMRCALAQKEGDISNFPKPPYKKGDKHSVYPRSFSITYFSEVVKEFNKKFPDFVIPGELIEFRNALAHGFIAEINSCGTDELVKFKKTKNGILETEFFLPLELSRMKQLRQSIREVRKNVMQKARDKNQ